MSVFQPTIVQASPLWLIPISIGLFSLIYYLDHKENQKKPIKQQSTKQILVLRSIGYTILALISITIASRFNTFKKDTLISGAEVELKNPNSAASAIADFQLIKANMTMYFVIIICGLFGIIGLFLLYKQKFQMALTILEVIAFCYFIAIKNRNITRDNRAYAVAKTFDSSL